MKGFELSFWMCSRVSFQDLVEENQGLESPQKYHHRSHWKVTHFMCHDLCQLKIPHWHVNGLKPSVKLWCWCISLLILKWEEERKMEEMQAVCIFRKCAESQEWSKILTNSLLTCSTSFLFLRDKSMHIAHLQSLLMMVKPRYSNLFFQTCVISKLETILGKITLESTQHKNKVRNWCYGF